MTAPNIEAIAASLRNCSLRGRTESTEHRVQEPPPLQLPEGEIRPPAECDGVTVELNSEVSLPFQWEQCLDLRTGEIYYINWKDGTRTTEDPRFRHRESCYYSSEEEYSEEEDEEEEVEDEYCDAEDSCSSVGKGADYYDDFYGVASPSNSDAGSASADSVACSHVLVAAGCKSCFMYFMVPKRVDSCPKCGGCLLHLGRNGYF